MDTETYAHPNPGPRCRKAWSTKRGSRADGGAGGGGLSLSLYETPRDTASDSYAQVDAPPVSLPPLGTIRRRPEEASVGPTDPVPAVLPVQRRLGPDEVTELVAAYRTGSTVKALAERYHVNRTTVMTHLRRQGVPKRVRRTLGPEDVERAVRLYEGGESIQSVARQLQLGSSTVGRVLNKAGVSMRPRGRRRSP